MQPIISVSSLFHYFGNDKEKTIVLENVDFEVNEGEFIAIQGRSGSGKSTLLNLLGGFMKPIQGNIRVNNLDITELNENQLSKYRRNNIGFIFQSYHLFPNMSALDNVEEPLFIAGVKKKERSERALKILEKVGLSDRVNHLTHQLSGGQQQRVAIARALVTDPKIILADEPTGNLDANTGDDILDLICHINRDLGKTVVLVTHDNKVAALANKKVEIKEGALS